MLALLGLNRFILIGWLITAAAVPGAWFAGRWHQSRLDDVQTKIEALQATNAALEKARDDAATITLRQVEATGRERDKRLEAERLKAEAEAEADAREADLDRRLRDAQSFVLPPDTSGHVCDLSDDDIDWLRKHYPPGPIHQPKPSAPSH